jgi:hypothetical protein
MNKKVSESVIGQQEDKPTREERDAAFSSSAGRKAAEVPQNIQKAMNARDRACGCSSERGAELSDIEDAEEEFAMKNAPKGDAPVGLELETMSEETRDGLYGD